MMAKRKTITKLSDLTPDTQNANKGTERGRYMVEASLTETGAGRSIVADKDGRIIAGNKTLEAWAGMGGAVKIVETDGQELVVVRRTDLDLSDPKGKARKLAYYDNRAGQVGLEWDAEQLLADVNAGVDLAAMFKADEIAELLAGVKGGAEADAEPQIDQAEELNKKWQVKPGDLWRIGAHRLLCGDSTKAADVARVMGGERAGACVTDSPYGINREGIENDDPEGLRGLFDGVLACMPIDNGAVINFQSPRLFPIWIDAARAAGHKFERALWFYDETDVTFPWRGWLMTSQIALVSSVGKAQWSDKGPYHHDCYTVKTAGKQENTGGHATAKPLDVIRDLVAHTSGTVYEPFAGSGTTLVACENLGRKCRAVEISPAYCAVILERMAQAFPKLEITRDDGAG